MNKIILSTIVVFVFFLILSIVSYYALFGRYNENNSQLTKEEAILIAKKELEFTDSEIIEFGQVKNLSEAEKKTLSVYKDVDNGDYYLILKTTRKLVFINPKSKKIVRTDNILYKNEQK